MGPVDEVRAFNRFYTRVIGLLEEGLLETPYSLTEARALFELARRDRTALSELRRAMGVDAGYLSRILGRFDSDGLLRRRPSPTDARQQVLELTRRGKSVARTLDARSARQVEQLLDGLTADDQRRLVDGMAAIRAALDTRTPAQRGSARSRRRRPRVGGLAPRRDLRRGVRLG